MVGRVDRELARHREDGQRELKARLRDQARALGRLAEDVNGQRDDIQSLLGVIAEQNAVIREFQQAKAVGEHKQTAAENKASFRVSSKHERSRIRRRHTLGVTMPWQELFLPT